MAMIFSDWRPRIALRMAAGNDEIKRWLNQATFAKASTGHWMAWKGDDPSRIAVLPPDHPEGSECFWLDSWDKDDTIETVIEYVESGRFDTDDGVVLSLQILNPKTGEWE
ncbi:hypothetical protein F6R98_20110 [Candidatus Methylospira mobilis]|uniref:Uncharacterized protein n=1 Tax=Candidatus Methylospira mobilis TaxID=1808979 RepID=A0A5Q0BRE6_9GAMM|nr:hypothetical protein [Candidatus Methylospira mobilis]QFY44647.1 hypothetical protein F6R98_20110 [Candidatus Methylospira mobilis]